MKLYTVNDYIRDTYGEKLYKLALNAGTTCPNRDGTAGTGGCIFCSAKGSGDFAEDAGMDIMAQIEAGKRRISGKTDCRRFIAYFQSFTNTYGNPEILRKKFFAAIHHPDIAILSIATRPDCIGDDTVAMLKELAAVKPVWVELGLQTIHEKTAQLINRCYTLPVYDRAVSRLKTIGVHVVTHMILGLPGESVQDMTETAAYIGRSGADGIKLHLLHVLSGTPLADMYRNKEYEPMSMEAYTDALISCLKMLPSGMVVHRMTDDGPKKLLLAPLWSGDKKRVLNYIHRRLSDIN